jgi:hypothetical protein
MLNKPKRTTGEDGNVKEIIEHKDISIEDVDRAMHGWLDKKMNLHCQTNKGWKKVEVKWVAGERAYASKIKKEMRDPSGALILPIITLQRTGMKKDPAMKGTAWAHIPAVQDAAGGSLTIAKRINQKKSSAFSSADARRRAKNDNSPNFRTRKKEKVVYETISVPMPAYVEVQYEIDIWAEYQQQMNEILQPFATRRGGVNNFSVEHGGLRYEAFMDADFSTESNVGELDTDERKYEAKVSIRVLATLLGDGTNADRPRTVIRESAVKVQMSRERTMLGDEGR